jgi:hypothetical protein
LRPPVDQELSTPRVLGGRAVRGVHSMAP